jgi:hypothetical protein
VFFDHHWLSGVLFYIVNTISGFTGLVILKMIVLLTAFALLFRAAMKRADFWAVALCSVPAILILIERADVRPEMFSYLFISVYLYILYAFSEHPERSTIYWLVPLQLLWVNMHVFFSIGLMITSGFLGERFVLHWKDWRTDLRLRKLFVVFVLLFAVSFINPRGAGGVFYRYVSNFPAIISENESIVDITKTRPIWVDVSTGLLAPMISLLVLSYVWGARRKPFPLFNLTAVLATAIMSYVIIRSVALFGMMLLLALSMNFDSVVVRIRAWLAREAPRIARRIGMLCGVLFAGGLVLGIFYGPDRVLSYQERGIGTVHDSGSAAAFFDQEGLHGPIFNDSNSGSYLIYYLYPREKVFVDNRFGDAYSASFFSDTLFRMVNDEATWQAKLKSYDFNVIFYYHYLAGLNDRLFLSKRMNDPAWALVYADNYNVILVRNVPENQAVITKYRITKENAAQRLRPLIDSTNIDDQIAAGDLFNMIGLPDLAVSTYYHVAVHWPNRYRPWLIMGQMESSKGNPTDLVLATMFLQKSIDVGGVSAEAYAFLGLAFFKLTEYQRAREAIDAALALDPGRGDARELSKEIDAALAKQVQP